METMPQRNNCTCAEDTGRVTELYHAVQANDEVEVKALLRSGGRDQLNAREPVNGWTPLTIACVNGHTSLASILLDAGAERSLPDHRNWTAKEHAVFRGHLKLSKLLGDSTRQASIGAARLKPSGFTSVGYQRRCNESQIFVYLGPSHTRSDLKPFEINSHSPLAQETYSGERRSMSIALEASGTSRDPSFSFELPSKHIMVNTPVRFCASVPEQVTLIFNLFHGTPASDDKTRPIGTGIFLLQNLRQGLAPKRESLIRHYTIPILLNGTMDCIGAVTFSVLVISPFQSQSSQTNPSAGFWKEQVPYPLVGHRGSGANSTARTNLQIGENTFQSFLTAVNRGACAVEFDVQLTKDYKPIIYHDFHVKETGGDIPVHGLTSDQFEHCSRSQAPRSDLLSSAENRFLKKSDDGAKFSRRPRSNSMNSYDDYRAQDLLEKVKHTEEGLLGHFKGNIRGCSIQEPSTTLKELLTRLPESVPFDLEIKYPMLWEAEDRSMEYFAIELNYYVDTILTMVFQHCGKRNITISSFSPEICIALMCKQDTFPVLLISKAGSVPVSDIRAGSLKGAIDFATAWNLTGIVMLSDPFVMCPRLLTYAKDCGLVVCSYGELNNDPECARVSYCLIIP